MNIHTVRDNLKNTIAGKERFLLDLRQGLKADLTDGAYIAVDATARLLEVNIDELKRILADVEVCCEKATEDSWALNPDRSGGQFTEDEINNAGRWV